MAFARRDRLDAPGAVYGEVVVPRAVVDEVVSEPACSRVRAARWIRVEAVSEGADRRMFGSRPHAGEVEVMLLALERGADLVIMDDNAAKKTAKFLGLRVTGTLGVLLRAKRGGVVPSVAGLLDAFVADGLYVTDGLRRLVLEQAGEA